LNLLPSASAPSPSGTPPPVPADRTSSPTRRQVLLQTTEGRILLVGLSLTVLALAAFAACWIWYPDQTLVYGAMAGLNLTIGRAAGMSFGYASGLGHLQVVPVNMVIETIQVLVVYPLFALTWTHLIDTPRWTATMARMHHSAEEYRGTIQRFGILGLFVFVFTPFWMTGPVVGAIIGFLIGLRARTNLTVVLGATYVAIGLWALLLNELSRWAAAYNHYAPFALVLGIALLALTGRLMRRLPGQNIIAPPK
jgi:uncharacterized membrane protein